MVNYSFKKSMVKQLQFSIIPYLQYKNNNNNFCFFALDLLLQAVIQLCKVSESEILRKVYGHILSSK